MIHRLLFCLVVLFASSAFAQAPAPRALYFCKQDTPVERIDAPRANEQLVMVLVPGSPPPSSQEHPHIRYLEGWETIEDAAARLSAVPGAVLVVTELEYLVRRDRTALAARQEDTWCNAHGLGRVTGYSRIHDRPPPPGVERRPPPPGDSAPVDPRGDGPVVGGPGNGSAGSSSEREHSETAPPPPEDAPLPGARLLFEGPLVLMWTVEGEQTFPGSLFGGGNEGRLAYRLHSPGQAFSLMQSFPEGDAWDLTFRARRADERSGRISAIRLESQLRYRCQGLTSEHNFVVGATTWYARDGNEAGVQLDWRDAMERAERFCASRQQEGGAPSSVSAITGTVTGSVSLVGGARTPTRHVLTVE